MISPPKRVKKPVVFINNCRCIFYHIFMIAIITAQSTFHACGRNSMKRNGVVISQYEKHGRKFFESNHGMGVEFLFFVGLAKQGEIKRGPNQRLLS